MSDIQLSCYTEPWGMDRLIAAIARIGDCGYTGIECPAAIVQKYEDRLHVFEEILETSHLRLSAVFQSLDLFDKDHADEQVERAANSARFAGAAGGARLVISHAGPTPDVMTDETWATLCAILEEIGHRCREFSVDVCFLPRAQVGVASEKDIKRFLASTDPKTIHLAIDTAEIVQADGMPHRVAKAHLDRIRVIRFRDIAGVKRRSRSSAAKPVPTPPFGRGVVNFEAMAKTLLEANYKGWVTVDILGETQPPLDAIAGAHRFLLRKSGLFPA